MINDIEADKQLFVSYKGSPVSNYPQLEKLGNDINGLSKLSELTVTWIDVGQADSILINSKGGDKMVVDTGDSFEDAKKRTVNAVHYSVDCL